MIVTKMEELKEKIKKFEIMFINEKDTLQIMKVCHWKKG